MTSPPPPPPRGRRPSISKPIAWLARASHTQPHAQLHISAPQLVNDFCTPAHPRYGVLGAGATVVRTPQDALARAAATAVPPAEPPGAADDDGSSYDDEPEPHSPASPALPALPLTSRSSPNLLALDDSPSRIRSTRALPPVPLHVEPTPPQPPFAPLLLAPVPDVLIDPAALLVTLDTATAALRTTYQTLASRPSHLADFLHTLTRDRQKPSFRDTLVEEEEDDPDDYDDDGHRLSSPDSPFTSLFNAHLVSSGLLPQPPGVIHLFLDRPSAPYPHILAYLRTPTEHPALPRAVAQPDRLEDLLELRDEARYLGLDELHRLCCDAVRRRQGHVRGASSGAARRRAPTTQARGSSGSDVGPPASPVSTRARSPRSASDWI